jgi:hypothetical protein
MLSNSAMFVRQSLLASILLAACATAAFAAGANHEYRVEIDADMRHMWVEARFREPVDSVTAKSNDAGDFLVAAWDCGNDNPIRLRNRRMMLPVSGITCMNYTVDLEGAARHERQNRTLAAGNRVISPSLWLWRPRLTDGREIDVHFHLPDDMQVSVPWPRHESRPFDFHLGQSPESSDAPAVFGTFDYREVEVAGATLRVSVLRGANPRDRDLDADGLSAWIRATASDVSLAYGRFPHPSPQVVVIPVGDTRQSSDPVPFGRVIRDGGETIELYVDERQSLDTLLGDWTATHEFSHLMLPYVERRHRWVSEGFAQYYQNVLLSRSGAHDRQKAWQELYEGFERGRRSRPELSPNEATAGNHRESRMKTYWSGAALALMADVALREQTGGRETLDDVMGRLQACCLPSDRVWSGPELFETLDSLATKPVFMALYRRYADTAGFPDTRPLFERLGLSTAGDEVRLQRSGDLAHIRTAITQPDPAASRWRERVVADGRPLLRGPGSAGSR